MMEASPFRLTAPGMERRQWLLLGAALGLAAALFAALYVAQEHPVYAYDFGMYWHAFQESGATLAANPYRWLAELVGSIRWNDYNLAPVAALMPSWLLFGGGRTGYVASLAALYVVPAALLASRLAEGRTRSEARLAILAALTFPVFWNAALRGMPDVVGLIPLSLAAMRLRRSGFMAAATSREALTTGMLLWLSFMFRRWYAFAIVALLAFSAACRLITLAAQARREGWPAARTALLPSLRLWALMAAGSLAPLIWYQGPLVWNILNTDYADIYSAYQASAATQLADYYGWFGPVTVMLAAAGAVRDIRRKAWDTIFCLAVAVLTALLFSRVQAPSVHHPLPVALMLFPTYFSGLSGLWGALPRGLRLVVPGFLVLNFANAFAPATPGAWDAARNILQERRYPPLHLPGFAEYRRLADDLAALPSKGRIAVFASSAELSAYLLAEIEPSLRPRLGGTSEVDLRDRFSWTSLRADYAVIADPTPLHLNPDGQRVISVPAADIRAGTGIGASYRLLHGGYRIDGGYVAAIYQREALVPPAEVYKLAARFHSFYPQWKATEPRAAMLLASSTFSRGEGGGSLALEGPFAIVLKPGTSAATALTFPTGAPFGATSLRVALRGADGGACPAGNGPEVTLAAGAGSVPQVLVPGETGEVTLTSTSGSAVLSAAPASGTGCTEAVATFGFAPW